jgi:DNA-directed RNA polymerase specialized sigma24 family protein
MTTDDLSSFLAGSAGPLHNLALSLTGSHAGADDLLQQTLEKVARAWRPDIAQPLAYARTTMMRTYVSERRRAHWRRETVVLRYLEDLPVHEVAGLMRCSEGNVKRCSYDGLPALRTALTPCQHDTETAGGAR